MEAAERLERALCDVFVPISALLRDLHGLGQRQGTPGAALGAAGAPPVPPACAGISSAAAAVRVPDSRPSKRVLLPGP